MTKEEAVIYFAEIEGKMRQPSKKALRLLLVLIMAATCLVKHGEARFCQSTFIAVLVQLIPCRPALSPFHPLPPTEVCCNALRGVGQPCVCALLNGPPIAGVDRNLAMLLPQKCAANFDPCM